MSSLNNRQSNWHPNFRIESTLPDTRAIHTNFAIKVILYTVILIIAAFVLEREHQSYILRQTINGLEKQVQNAASANRSRLAKSEQFRKLALNAKELQRFFKAPLTAHESIVELASIKSEELTFTRVALSESVTQANRKKKSDSRVKFKLIVFGNVKDLSVLTQFKRELEESQLLNPAGYIVTISEKIEPRDAETGIIPFKLTVSLETAGKDSK